MSILTLEVYDTLALRDGTWVPEQTWQMTIDTRFIASAEPTGDGKAVATTRFTLAGSSHGYRTTMAYEAFMDAWLGGAT
jgi:hypothetical protein